jgi:hypothetical protein
MFTTEIKSHEISAFVKTKKEEDDDKNGKLKTFCFDVFPVRMRQSDVQITHKKEIIPCDIKNDLVLSSSRCDL